MRGCCHGSFGLFPSFVDVRLSDGRVLFWWARISSILEGHGPLPWAVVVERLKCVLLADLGPADEFQRNGADAVCKVVEVGREVAWESSDWFVVALFEVPCGSELVAFLMEVREVFVVVELFRLAFRVLFPSALGGFDECLGALGLGWICFDVSVLSAVDNGVGS